LQTLLTSEATIIGSLFQVNRDGSGPFYCSLYAPGHSISAVICHGSVYATGEGETPEDAIYTAREKMWKGL
jgi:hypothetical protein